tara:strand:+ start:276 stop:473 length:198 start_codon:yes stop_codon:yes gene_type:complete
MFICEIYCNGIQVLTPTFYQSLKKIAEDLELSSNQIYDIFEGRTTKKYASKMMPKISIKKIQSAS